MSIEAMKHTPGPWYADTNGGIWRRKPGDLYENGGGVAGDKQLATVWKGWVNEGEIGYPLEANARLIAAAPDLLEALQDVCARLLYRGVSTDAGHPDRTALQVARSAIAKATGGEV
jgi:hypothetical protein